ncbi:thiamine diphosphokinase [Desulfobacterales bacterium HSG16]|nr:thiamine diphosphokinase [Desulfobacterales bacterium HSG16]
MKTFIFANGHFNESESAFERIGSKDSIIAADGGLHHCLSWGFFPDILVGDLDSVNPRTLELIKNSECIIHEFPVKKDQTDLELALDIALESDTDEIIVFGALGGRWDMTVSNICHLAAKNKGNHNIRLIDGFQEISFIKGPMRRIFKGNSGELLSLVPISSVVEGIVTDGLEYPLNDETMGFGSTRGVSNVFTQKDASVAVKKGLLICVHILSL